MCKYLMGGFAVLNIWCFAGKLVKADKPRGVNVCKYPVGSFMVQNTWS